MSAAVAPTRRAGCLTFAGEAAVALIRLRDGFDDLSELDRARLASELRQLADRFVPRGPRPIA